MIRIYILIFTTMIFLLCKNADAACVLDEFEIPKLLLSAGKSDVIFCNKEINTSRVINALRVVDLYWARGTTNQERYELLSRRYKEAVNKFYNIKKPEQYTIPLSEPERILQGYKVNQINIISSENMEISLQVKWEQEGYQGTMTYIMVLVYEGSKWTIANVHI